MTTTATDDQPATDLAETPITAAHEAASGITDTAERPLHEARCTHEGCKVRVQFRSTSSGAGFAIEARHGVDHEQSFAIGQHGHPMCPFGHGELTLSDEQLPRDEAFALAQERLAAAAGHAEQQRLPGVVMPFNFQGAYLELEEKAVEVDRLHAEYKAAAEEARDAKKAWEKAAELHVKMSIECRRRRRAKEGAPAEDLFDESEREPATNLVRCTWEEQHPGESCPICSSDDLQPEKPRDSVLHIDEVAELLDVRSAVEVSDALDAIDIVVHLDIVRGWEPADRAAVLAWASYDINDSSVTDPRPERPKVLGTGHVAGASISDMPQCCTQCDAVLIAAPEEGEFANYYDVGVLVGTDCPGRAKAEGHHYPEKKKRGRRKPAEE